ncbi:alpha,alpha-trehalose-phosphate synthase (UDP-forming) [Hyphomicrobium sp. DMF-1]|jgi:trehalose 6-phosphate synthase|uniref:alpha,alpha-trehalose-phosphate synthase (UDP-forming) n=1 Tax=Hyphomicrobium sp. DMF-1 TaxID=3019544 RepID=UPI0022EBB007|nr:trehalose-6-phosphate synthase [Hyphomicrobium sp. DMF-1]WBT36862.1 trehalose-6-phosphate synthase [Hyphomicrobium sp. DMF-1]
MIACAVALFALTLLGPLVTSLVDDWSRRDVELRATLVFNSVSGPLSAMLENGQTDHINELFERVATDSRIVAVAVCRDGKEPAHATKLMPSSISCEKIARSDTESFSSVIVNGRRMLIGAYPIVSRTDPSREIEGHFIIVHDLSFAEHRGQEARNYLTLMLGGIILASGALAIGLVLYLIRNWLRTFKQAVTSATSPGVRNAAASYGPLDKEVRQVLRQLEMSQSAIDRDQANWSKETLRDIMLAELPGVEVLVVANREPYIHNHGPGGIELQTPASGLVSAVEPVMRACGGTWIAHGSGTADRETVDANDCIGVPPRSPEYTLRRIWISEEEQDGYYYGLANEGLWPLCHIAFTRPVFRESDWRTYRAVNERFADAVAAEAKTSSPIVLIQDYHFALLPQMVRERIPDATIITFWHIPWPNAETFGIFPWKEEIIHGLLGSSIIGFHTQFHCNNFLETVDRFVESRIDREQESVTLKGHETFIRPYPISIDWPPAALANQKSIQDCRDAVRKRLDLPPETKIAVGIERFDYTKGVLDRIRAVDTLLETHPEWRGRFVLVQAAAPTRSKLQTYKGLQDEAMALAEEVNAKYADVSPQPIRLIIRHHEPSEVFELFRAADVCIVSSLHDGMNLVAKEFIAARDDERGVLMLSHFAGASRELAEALIINPYDAHATGEVLHSALVMPETEQHERMRLMRAYVSTRNVYRWAGQMLLDASRLRKKQRILEIAALDTDRAG